MFADEFTKQSSDLASYGYTWEILPHKSADPACYSPTTHPLRGADTWYCADGTLSYYNTPWFLCSATFNTCSNPSWTLTPDGLNCTKSIIGCHETPETVSEITLLAAIVYGESSTISSYEEKAAIANVVVRKGKSYGFTTVNEYILSKRGKQIRATKGKNERYNTAMCSNVEIEHPLEYQAALNALDEQGVDYANGGCYWDGYDLKTEGSGHLHYEWGYLITNPSHNVLNISSTDPHSGAYPYTLESTAGFGNTIFFKLTNAYMSATGVKQCH